MRLFVAIALPEPLRDRLAGLASGLPGVRWVAPENLHLSLRFIGEVDRHQAVEIDSALGAVRGGPFPVAFRGLDYFANGKRPRLLYLKVEPQPELKALQERIERALRRAGLAPEGRKYRPHVTLARFKAPPGHRFGEYLARHGLFDGGGFEVAGFTLFSSHLGRDGATYTAEADYPLRPEGAAALGVARQGSGI